MPGLPFLQADDLRRLGRATPPAQACRCDAISSRGWESVVAPLLPADFECVGTLLDGSPDGEPTLTEWHPQGTS